MGAFGGSDESVYLIGMMGAGKTTTGTLLAEKLGWPYLDSDAEVEAATGSTVPEIFANRGEAAFRREESAVLRRAMASEQPAIVGVAGGAVLDPENRALLASTGRVVWLRAEVDTIVGRVGTGVGRPLLDHHPAATLARLDAERRPVYAALANVVVDVDRRSPAKVVTEILDALARGEAHMTP